MKKNLTDYDVYSEDMLAYLRMYGPHFNKKLCEFAVSKMTKMVDNKETNIVPYTKDHINNILKNNNVYIVNNVLYDQVFVANMCKADFLGSSIADEKHLALYIRDVIDDVDAPDGLIFNRWFSDMCFKGIPVDWEEML